MHSDNATSAPAPQQQQQQQQQQQAAPVAVTPSSSSSGNVATDLNMWQQIWDDEKTGWKYEEKMDLPTKNYQFLAETLPLKGHESVLVPLCGDSPIMPLLVSKGHQVVGVEYVPKAVEKLFALFPDATFAKEEQPQQEHSLQRFTSKNVSLTMYQGDFFCFTSPFLFDVVYDRASLVAIEPPKRELYAQVIFNSLKSDGYYLLVVIGERQDPAKRFTGPPYIVTKEDIVQLYGPQSTVAAKSTHYLEIINFVECEEGPNGRVHRYLLKKTSKTKL